MGGISSIESLYQTMKNCEDKRRNEISWFHWRFRRISMLRYVSPLVCIEILFELEGDEWIQWIKYSSSEWWYASTTTEIAFLFQLELDSMCFFSVSFFPARAKHINGWIYADERMRRTDRWMRYNNMIKEATWKGEQDQIFLFYLLNTDFSLEKSHATRCLICHS